MSTDNQAPLFGKVHRHFFIDTTQHSFRRLQWIRQVSRAYKHEKQRSSQRKCREYLSNLPFHCDNVTHQGISISQPYYEEMYMECNVGHMSSDLVRVLHVDLHMCITWGSWLPHQLISGTDWADNSLPQCVVDSSMQLQGEAALSTNINTLLHLVTI